MINSQRVFIDCIKKKVFDFYSPFISGNIILYGASTYGKMLYGLFGEFGWKDYIISYCDGNEKLDGTFVNNVPVKKLDTLINEYPGATYIIASNHIEAIQKRLNENGLKSVYSSGLVRFLERQYADIIYNAPDDNIIYCWKWLEWFEKRGRENAFNQIMSELEELFDDERSKQILQERIAFFLTGDTSHIENTPIDSPAYFCEGIYQISEDEVLMDCGAFTGDTLLDFTRRTKLSYKKVLSFEPDPMNYSITLSTINKHKWKDIILINAAVGEENGYSFFDASGTDGSRLCPAGDAKVKVVKLDDYFGERPTLIKMDVEGAEMAALKGAEEIITKLKPKLAICLDHKCFDFLDIPKYIHQLVPEYKLKVRHHTDVLYDTVLYAYIE